MKESGFQRINSFSKKAAFEAVALSRKKLGTLARALNNGARLEQT